MTYLYGHKSEDIRKLQLALGINADGAFGNGTLEAVKKWQSDHSIDPADGVVRQDMLDLLFPKPKKINWLSLLPTILNLLNGKTNMNKDQFINLITTVVQVASGVAVGWGVLDAPTWVPVGAAIVAIATWVYTHVWNKTA
mgnify:CR=1 FL=1